MRITKTGAGRSSNVGLGLEFMFRHFTAVFF